MIHINAMGRLQHFAFGRISAMAWDARLSVFQRVLAFSWCQARIPTREARFHPQGIIEWET